MWDKIAIASADHRTTKGRRKSVSPRHVAKVARRAAQWGLRVQQLDDLTVVIDNLKHPTQIISFYPDEDSEPVFDFRDEDPVWVVGNESRGRVCYFDGSTVGIIYDGFDDRYQSVEDVTIVSHAGE